MRMWDALAEWWHGVWFDYHYAQAKKHRGTKKEAHHRAKFWAHSDKLTKE